jgi:hypothetical protein
VSYMLSRTLLIFHRGLNTINLSTLNTFQQFMLFILIILGSVIFVSAFVVHIRKKAFEKRFKSVIERQRRKRERRKSSRGPLSLVSHFLMRFARSDNRTSVPGSIIEDSGNLAIDVSRPTEEDPRGRARTIRYEGENRNSIHLNPDKSDINGSSPSERRHNHFLSMQGAGAHSNATARVRSGSRPSLPDLTPNLAPRSFGKRARTYLPFPSSGYISRNSQFHHLTNAEREKLGGCEYRAIQFLAWIVPIYFVLWQFLGCLGLGAYVAHVRPGPSRENGLNPWYVLHIDS